MDIQSIQIQFNIMELNINTIKLGQYVKVKTGIKAPDFEYQLMDDWQGKVTEILKTDGLIEIEWDVKTLLNTPYQYLYDTISNGYDYELMTLNIEELLSIKKRTVTAKEQSDLNAKLYWIDFYDVQEIDEAYAEIFEGVDVEDEFALLKRWKEHLNETLQFPFETEVVETERGGLRFGTKIKLLALDDYDDMYGIFGTGKSEMGTVTFPICNLEATNQASDNYELLNNYVIWFANR